MRRASEEAQRRADEAEERELALTEEKEGLLAALREAQEQRDVEAQHRETAETRCLGRLGQGHSQVQPAHQSFARAGGQALRPAPPGRRSQRDRGQSAWRRSWTSMQIKDVSLSSCKGYMSKHA